MKSRTVIRIVTIVAFIIGLITISFATFSVLNTLTISDVKNLDKHNSTNFPNSSTGGDDDANYWKSSLYPGSPKYFMTTTTVTIVDGQPITILCVDQKSKLTAMAVYERLHSIELKHAMSASTTVLLITLVYQITVGIFICSIFTTRQMAQWFKVNSTVMILTLVCIFITIVCQMDYTKYKIVLCNESSSSTPLNDHDNENMSHTKFLNVIYLALGANFFILSYTYILLSTFLFDYENYEEALLDEYYNDYII